MITPKCNEWSQTQEAPRLAIFDIIPDEYAILFIDHHDCLMDADSIRRVDKPGGMIKAKFFQEMFLLGKEEAWKLTA